jgi:hypothetical protein
MVPGQSANDRSTDAWQGRTLHDCVWKPALFGVQLLHVITVINFRFVIIVSLCEII